MKELLDCTIRDGGYINNWNFTNEQIRHLYCELKDSNIEYMEIGFRTISSFNNVDNFGPQYFTTDEYLDELLEDIYDESKCKIAVMCQIDIMDIKDFVPKKNSKVSLVRVLQAYHGFKNKTDDEIDYDLLNKSVDTINALYDLGYEVSYNIGRIDKIKLEQLHEICKTISTSKTKFFYMADTYGSTDFNLLRTYIKYVMCLFEDVFNRKDIKIGFHAHNNFQNATAKSLFALLEGAYIIDGCIHGFGRGSGNAITELLMIDLNNNYEKKYNFINLFDFGNKHLKSYDNSDDILSYSDIIYILSAHYGMHVNYAIELNNKIDKMDIKTVNRKFVGIKNSGKNMFYFKNLL